ncbi:MAG: 2'-5' RNA ligase family protein [Chloroflexota bacterium]
MVDFIRNVFNPPQRIPYSIVALLDDEYGAFIKTLWDELETEFGISFPFDEPIPHITHIQAWTIKHDALHQALEKFASQQAPYTIRTSGLGIFTGEKNALYVSVVRNPNLTAIQTTMIGTLAGSIEDLAETHLVNHWMPHISLAIGLMGDDVETLGKIVSHLARRSFTWEFRVTRLAVLGDEDDDTPFTITLRDG